MRLIAAVTAVFTFGGPARLHSQQHQPEAPTSAAVVHDTLTGIVVAIDTMKATGMMRQGGGGLALRILAGHDTISAHLGPVWHLKQQNPDGFAIGIMCRSTASP